MSKTENFRKKASHRGQQTLKNREKYWKYGKTSGKADYLRRKQEGKI